MLPATKAQPKEMLPLVDKPAIQYVVEEAVNAGLEEICIIIGKGKGSIEEHFAPSPDLERFLLEKGKEDLLREVRRVSELARIRFLLQPEPRGLGDAVLQARSFVGDEPFAVLLGDDILVGPVPPMTEVIRAARERGGSAVLLQRVPREETVRYGIVAGTEAVPGLYHLTRLVEKPSPETAPSDLAIIGRYVLQPEVFELLEEVKGDRSGEIQLTPALEGLARNRDVWGVLLNGRRMDSGTKLGYLKATVELALGREDLGSEFADYLGEILKEYRRGGFEPS
ncbi:MAG: UTP--glucose-1-phosphate uridylyltransferase [Firmicutes bacterium]|nr:UTP--glucose-1-phosphate uridylyltransferase [Bacillota bacterium]